MADEIMTVEQLAKYLKTGVPAIYKLAEEGKIPALKSETNGGLERKRKNEKCKN